MGRKKKKGGGAPASTWLNTYSDLVTLVLCFFAVLYNPAETNPKAQQAIQVSMLARGMGSKAGGNTLAVGQLAELGASILSLPSDQRGTSLGTALRRATSLFTPEFKNVVSVRTDERGIIVTLASDAFFAPGSAQINVEATRDVLLRLGTLLSSDEVAGRKFRIEGHTDDTPIDSGGQWESNWELSAARAIAVLHYLSGLGVPESRFQVAGFADTMPVSTNDTPEGRAYNRRVDVVILDDAHL